MFIKLLTELGTKDNFLTMEVLAKSWSITYSIYQFAIMRQKICDAKFPFLLYLT